MESRCSRSLTGGRASLSAHNSPSPWLGLLIGVTPTRLERPLPHSLVSSPVLMCGTLPSSSPGPPHYSWPTSATQTPRGCFCLVSGDNIAADCNIAGRRAVNPLGAWSQPFSPDPTVQIAGYRFTWAPLPLDPTRRPLVPLAQGSTDQPALAPSRWSP
jgi:hypothetical protein